MGGRDTAKGIKIQGIVAVLNALTKNDWHSMCMEPEMVGRSTDKIDIQWDLLQGRQRIEQVKSTESVIHKYSIKTYLNDMIEETPSADEYVLYTIGSITTDTSKFVQALNDGSIDHNELMDHPHLSSRLDHIRIIVRDFDFEALEALAFKLLYTFYSEKHMLLTANELEARTAALFHEFDRLPIMRKTLTRQELEMKLLAWGDTLARGTLELAEKQELKEALGAFKSKFEFLKHFLYDPTHQFQGEGRISRLNQVEEYQTVFDLIGIQTRYLKLLEELEYYDSQRAEMLTLYARYKEDKQAGMNDSYLQRQADIVNHLSFNVIEKSIQQSAPIQEFIDYVAELHDQMYK